jgi:hypothetical protein
MKSNIPLFCKPVKITKEYNSGKRVSFVPPIRQYLIISIIFFIFLVNFTTINFNFMPSGDFIEILYYYIPIYLGIALWRNDETKWIRFIFREGLILFFYLIALILSLSVSLTYGVSKL